MRSRYARVASTGPTLPARMACASSNIEVNVSSSMRGLPSHAEVRALHVLVVEEVAAGSGEHDAAVLEHVAAPGQGQRLAGVLLDQQDRGALVVDLADDPEDLLHDPRGQLERGLVQYQQARARHERAADGQYLLLVARYGAGGLAALLSQDGEEPEHALEA